jgi:hypothetical protein
MLIFVDEIADICQSALERDPGSARKRDPAQVMREGIDAADAKPSTA